MSEHAFFCYRSCRNASQVEFSDVLSGCVKSNAPPLLLGAGAGNKAANMYMRKYMVKKDVQLAQALAVMIDAGKHIKSWPSVAGDTGEDNGHGDDQAAPPLAAGAYVGPYMGTVWTEEDDEARHDDEAAAADGGGGGHYTFSIRDGAHAVVLDGGEGPSVNALKFINHSCDPNCRMQELFVGGCWHVLVFALRDVAWGEELTHDYRLGTEDPDDPRLRIACRCGAAACRGSLFELHEW